MDDTEADQRMGRLLRNILLTPDQVSDVLGVPRRRVISRQLLRLLPWVLVSPRKLMLPAEALLAFSLDYEAGTKTVQFKRRK